MWTGVVGRAGPRVEDVADTGDRDVTWLEWVLVVVVVLVVLVALAAGVQWWRRRGGVRRTED